MDSEEVLAAISGGESELIEFKKGFPGAEKLGLYISALANTARLVGAPCGYLFIGVEDDGKIVGTNWDWKKETVKGGSPLEFMLKERTEPEVEFGFESVIVESLRVVVLKVAATKGVPASFSGERYFRVGSATPLLKKYPESEAKLWGMLTGEVTYDGLPLWSYLLNAERMAVGLRRHMVRVVVIDGVLKTDNQKLDKVFESGYTKSLGEAWDVIESHTSLEVLVGARRVKVFDHVGLREAFVNSVAHQDLMSDGVSLLIEIYDDRVEFNNPGNSRSDLTRLGISDPPNVELVEALIDLEWSEKRGSGFPKMLTGAGRVHAPAPKVITGDGYTRVICYAGRVFGELNPAERLEAVMAHGRLLALDDKFLSNAEVRERFGWDSSPGNMSTVSKLLGKLEERGFLEKHPDIPKAYRLI